MVCSVEELMSIFSDSPFFTELSIGERESLLEHFLIDHDHIVVKDRRR
jgi:hypothetical protein